MSRELQDQLAKTYPQIFGHPSFPMFHPSCSLECGDGWYRLIERLCHCVQGLTDEIGAVQHVAQQVKERSGALRFYWYVSDDRVDAMTELAEALSRFTCEECGALRVHYPSGGTANVCASCCGESRSQQLTDPLPSHGDLPMPTDRRESLLALYPKIFCDSVDGTLQPRCGIACGDGWYRLIERLCACVQSLVYHRDLPQPRAVQVKEKLGGLRFYWEGVGDERVAAMTHYAETLSLHICEVCGAPGALVREDCLRTRCELHRDTLA